LLARHAVTIKVQHCCAMCCQASAQLTAIAAPYDVTAAYRSVLHVILESRLDSWPGNADDTGLPANASAPLAGFARPKAAEYAAAGGH
jgi:hypothetical protein